MTVADVINVMESAMKITIMISAPVLVVSLLVGILIGILQAATQIQEMTITFVPKLIAVGLVLLFFGPWMLRMLLSFTVQLIYNIPNFVR
ncbi:MAG: flagellar biosynthesis protein FliQ [Thermosulfidibacteraceae bacterium]|jgi:flagellar biosynthetic protein FliQ